MKKQIIALLVILSAIYVSAQPTGYYNGTDGKDGDALKSALNDIISGHIQYSYFTSKEIFKLSDADPNNPANVLLIYSGFSHPNNDYGTGSNQLNREHVWAKSHGSFGDVPPMYNDVHNLKPEDASVNQDKSNLDFDNGGTQHPEATGCYFTDSTWEARDETKGDVARIIFYMATRYEGENGELNLEIADNNHTYPNAQHGKLSTLLQWNLQDPPDEFERNRNNVIYSFQKNRNPFIDNPEFAQMIWGGDVANPISIDDVQKVPEIAVAGDPVLISAQLSSMSGTISEVIINWGLSFDQLTHEAEMELTVDVFHGQIPGQEENVTVFYQIVATDETNQHSTVIYNYFVPKVFTGTIVSIYEIQGQQAVSPFKGQVVSTTGVVTANFGSSYFIQDGTGEWSGLFIYESGRNPSIGDSVVITGMIDEYYEKTEMKNISDYYLISSNNALPDPVVVNTGTVTEGYESVLVKVMNAECTDAVYQDDFFMWNVDDGSGILKIHNTSIFEFQPTEGASYDITGPMNYDFDEWKVELRFENDVMEGSDIQPPFVLSVQPIISTNIRIDFSEPVDAVSAQNIENYSINNGIVVETAVQHVFNKAQVNLTVTSLSGDYELTISNIKDLVGNVMQSQTFPVSYVGIEDIFNTMQLKVYPNPVKDKLRVSFKAEKTTDFHIKIIDLTGRIIQQENYQTDAGNHEFTMNLTNTQAGIYILEIISSDQSMQYKIIKK